MRNEIELFDLEEEAEEAFFDDNEYDEVDDLAELEAKFDEDEARAKRPLIRMGHQEGSSVSDVLNRRKVRRRLNLRD